MVKAQFDFSRLMNYSNAPLTDCRHGALDGRSQGNEDAAALVDRGDQYAGDLCARTRGIGADRLLDANFEGCTRRDRLRGKGRGGSEESEKAGRNEITEPGRQSRLLLVHFLPRGHGVPALRLTLSRVPASRRREVTKRLAGAGKLS